MLRPFEIGDKVAYNVSWLKSIACVTGDLPFARGTIQSFRFIGERTLVDVKWDDGTEMSVINTNLAHVGPNTQFCNC